MKMNVLIIHLESELLLMAYSVGRCTLSVCIVKTFNRMHQQFLFHVATTNTCIVCKTSYTFPNQLNCLVCANVEQLNLLCFLLLCISVNTEK